MVVIHNTFQVQSSIVQPTIEASQAINNLVDQVIHEVLEMVKLPVEQHYPQENVEPTLRRYTKVRKSIISDDYIIYLQYKN